MKKWIKYGVMILCAIAACMTIFDKVEANKDKTEDTTPETAAVQVVDM